MSNPPLDGQSIVPPPIKMMGLKTVRCQIVHYPASGNAGVTPIRWHILGVPSGAEQTPLVIIGELRVRDSIWSAAITVSTAIGVAETGLLVIESVQDAYQAARSLGPWCSEVLYDYAAANLRALVGATNSCDLVIPQTTPEPHIARISDDDLLDGDMSVGEAAD